MPRRRANQQRHFEQLEARLLLASDLKLFKGVVGAPLPKTEPQAIVGGVQSDRGQYGWAVSLQDSLGHFCGGTLISPDAVVTAAHCVEGQSVSPLSALIGREDLAGADGQRTTISQIIIHPAYDAETNDSDIAVLLLTDSVHETPIGYLSESNAELAAPGTTATTLGWGATREGGGSVTSLREVQVPIVSNQTANRQISHDGDITNQMLPAGRPEGGVDSCQGDSGGPLVVSDSNGNVHLAGVVSWGEGCARPNKYGVYTRVTSFSTWIDRIVGVEARGQVNFTQDRYVVGNEAQIVVRDANLDPTSPIEIVVRSESGDVEKLPLVPFSPGRFRGTIPIGDSDEARNNGVLGVTGAELITAVYTDADDGTGGSIEVTSTARIVVDDAANSAEGAVRVDSNSQTDGEIEVNGDVDWFQIETEAGQGYEFSVVLNGTLNDSVVTIYRDDGESVLGFDDDSGRGLGSRLSFFPTASGTVFIETAGFGANVGTYELSVAEIDTPSDDHSNIIGGATQMTVDDRQTGVIDSPDDSDWFQFDAVAGNVYQINAALGSLSDSRLRLIDADGRTELAFNDDVSELSLASRIFYRAEQSGPRFFEVSGFSGAEGSYAVTVTRSGDDHSNNIVDPTAFGEISTTALTELGSISPQDVDWFSFTASANRFYEIRTFLTSLPDTVVQLYDSTGATLLAMNDDHLESLASRIVWQAPEQAVYHIEVAGFEGVSGDYSITVRELATPLDDAGNRADLAVNFVAPDSFRGNINYEADVDWLQFDAIKGITYTFEVSLRSLDDSVLRIYDTDGTTLIAENDDVNFPDRSSLIEWTADSSGPKFLEVSGFDGFRGTYTLNATVEAAAGDVNVDGSIDATDIDLLFASINDGIANTQFDLNEDGQTDGADVDTLLHDIIGTVSGDADLNGQVQFVDFLALSSGFGGPGGWKNGNFNGDSTVDFQDFLELSRNFSG